MVDVKFPLLDWKTQIFRNGCTAYSNPAIHNLG